MEQKTLEFLKSFKLTNSEIQSIVNLCEGVLFADIERMMNNCKILVKYGYPKSDIDFLLLSNPGFLVDDNSNLEKKLKNLSRGGDIEELLKTNPNLI